MQKTTRAEIRIAAGPARYCDCGKPCYDKRGAMTAANMRYRQEHVKLRIYQCHGNVWHLTKVIRGSVHGKNRQWVNFSREKRSGRLSLDEE